MALKTSSNSAHCSGVATFYFSSYDDVIKWKHFPRYWPFVRGIHWSPVNSPHNGWWRGSLMFSLICAWINGWVSNHEAGDLRRHRAHSDVTVMRGPLVSFLLSHGWYLDLVDINVLDFSDITFLFVYPPGHIEAETKWTPFRRRHFQIHFRKWKCYNFG